MLPCALEICKDWFSRRRERTFALFQVTVPSGPFQRFSILVESGGFATLLHEGGPGCPGERFAVFAYRPGRTKALGDGWSDAEQRNQNGRREHSEHCRLR